MGACSSFQTIPDSSSDLALRGQGIEQARAKAVKIEKSEMAMEDPRSEESEVTSQSEDSERDYHDEIVEEEEVSLDQAELDRLDTEMERLHAELAQRYAEEHANCTGWCCEPHIVPEQPEPESWKPFVEVDPKPAGFW